MSQLKHLDLRFTSLTQLPQSIALNTNITQLNLSNNQLTQLPPSIVELTQLSVLNLRLNPFTPTYKTYLASVLKHIPLLHI